MPESSLTLTRLFGNFKFMASTNSLILSETVDVHYVPLLMFFYVPKDLKKFQISKNHSIVAYLYPLNLKSLKSFLSFFCVLFFFFQQILSRYFCKIYFNENYLYPSLNPIFVPGNGVALLFDSQSGINCCKFYHKYTRVIIQVTSYGRNKKISPVMPQ